MLPPNQNPRVSETETRNRSLPEVRNASAATSHRIACPMAEFPPAIFLGAPRI
jgi:hypothetical protein